MLRAFLSLCLLVVLGACAPAGGLVPSPSPSGPPPGAGPAATVLPSPAPSPSPASPTVAEIERLRAHLAGDPSDASAWRDLGFAFSQRVRETADPSLYAAADDAFERALALTPDDALLLAGIGGLQLGRHEFAAALETGRAAILLEPALAPAHAVVVDALVELGRYDEAAEALDELLALGLDLASLARLSYLRELHGDLEGAEAAMAIARGLPVASPENEAYITALHANLVAWLGRPEDARAELEEVLAALPGHAPSIAALARLDLRAGDVAAAVEGFRAASDILPLPEYVIALGETLELAGDLTAANESYGLARLEIQLLEAAGVEIDLDLALFEASHGDPGRALELATAAYAAAPTIRAADALAWALHKVGRDGEARARADEALRLGTVDPLLRYHSGMIWAALDNAELARRDLSAALAMDPGFSATGALEARQTLEALGD